MESHSDIRIKDIFEIKPGDMLAMAGSCEVDTIVNSANTTLMAGNGLDKSIHDRINAHLGQGDFNDKIHMIFDGEEKLADDAKRCKIGDAVVTPGYILCKNIIHTVGPYYDKTNSCMHQLERCYKNIIKLALDTPGIRKLAIPVICSNNNFPYKKAVSIAVATINNTLIKNKKHNQDSLMNIEKIYLVLYKQTEEECKKIYNKFNRLIEKEEMLHYRSLFEAQKNYYYEIKINDEEKRGYFTIAKLFREVLVLCRFLYPISLITRSWVRRFGWKAHKILIEAETIFQLLIAIVALWCYKYIPKECLHKMLLCLVVYILFDIISYLIGLIFLADIQRPSANVVRSLLLIGINYCCTIFSVAYLYCYIKGRASIWEALDFAILGAKAESLNSMWGYVLKFSRAGMNFFFVALIFAFFINHLKHRAFME